MSSVSKSAGAVPVHKSKAKAAQTRRGLLYALPDWLMIIVLFFVPIVLLVVMACSRWSLLGGNRGVNFPDNFVKVFENKLFWPSIWFTLEYTVIVTVFLLVLGLGMAMIVQESSKWNNVLRTCFLLPSATGLASASLLFYALYSPQVGPVTKILSSLGLMQEGGSVLATGQSALWATIIVIVWRFSGYYMLLMMIGLQAIPGDLYEAARMDGAGSWRIFRSITLPLMKPTIVMCLVYCVTGSILAFVLHSDQGWSEQLHHDRGAAHLQLRLRFQEGSGYGRGALADRAGGPGHHQLHPDARHARQHQVRKGR